MCESVSRGEGWATGREDERGSWREGVTGGWTEVLVLPSLTSSLSLLDYLAVVRFSMSFKHKLQPVSTSYLLGLIRAPWCSLHTPLFLIRLHFPICEPFLLFLCSFPSHLPPVAPQVSDISHFTLRSSQSIFKKFAHRVFSLVCFYNILHLSCSSFRFTKGVSDIQKWVLCLCLEWNKAGWGGRSGWKVCTLHCVII